MGAITCENWGISSLDISLDEGRLQLVLGQTDGLSVMVNGCGMMDRDTGPTSHSLQEKLLWPLLVDA